MPWKFGFGFWFWVFGWVDVCFWVGFGFGFWFWFNLMVKKLYLLNNDFFLFHFYSGSLLGTS